MAIDLRKMPCGPVVLHCSADRGSAGETAAACTEKSRFFWVVRSWAPSHRLSMRPFARAAVTKGHKPGV